MTSQNQTAATVTVASSINIVALMDQEDLWVDNVLPFVGMGQYAFIGASNKQLNRLYKAYCKTVQNPPFVKHDEDREALRMELWRGTVHPSVERRGDDDHCQHKPWRKATDTDTFDTPHSPPWHVPNTGSVVTLVRESGYGALAIVDAWSSWGILQF
ncbi:expressed unknown protein [Seminavis robusta]|uniref:Uncharacterized protein n=1 Tax=Seminavis robusta TaxID=568900 RepID=A0A9N8H4Q3_9STRA|nr:expressed unknown protein [Seminavis robusta]|eukprot:Sro55_g032510.1 n/a (157) ;mRNA; f:132857-133327